MPLLPGIFASSGGEIYKLKLSTNFADGTLTNNNQTWFPEVNSVRGYSGAILDKVFYGDFTVIASWQHNYMGIGMVYKGTPSTADFIGTSSDGGGLYWATVSQSGFGTGAGYSFLGQYHAPISANGGTSNRKKTYFKWQRVTNTLTLQYSYKGASGPWTNFSDNYTATASTGDGVIIGMGEADEVEWDPFRLISVNGESVSLVSTSNDIGPNVLTPYAYYGNATAMTWSTSSTLSEAGSPSLTADAFDSITSTNWPSYGYQHQASGGGDGDLWIGVDLGAGKAIVPTKTAAIGYPGGSHWSNNNYVKASNDGTNYTTLATWASHPGNTTSSGYLIYNDSSNHRHSYVSKNIDTYGIPITTTTAYRYFRLGGTNWNASNGYQLVMNWLLYGIQT